MHRFGDFGFGPMHGFGWIFMVLFWLAVILIIGYLLRMVLGGGATGKRKEDALELLNRRYARGEIDKPTYDRMKDDILG